MADNYFGLTDTGRVRTNNEDTFISQKIAGNKFILAAVIDGVGGYNGGEVAAALAREQVLQQMDGAEVDEDIIPALINSLRKASHSIYERRQQNKELDSMACVATLAVIDLKNNQFYYAHVGDTRLYLLRDESLVKISKDHSFVGFLEDSGRLTEAAAMSHLKRNEINKALGFDQQIETDDEYIETGKSPFLPGDMLLLCSDGLSDMVDKASITAIITQKSSLKDKATHLIEAANNNGGNDNITVVLVQNNKTAQRPAATMPVAGIKNKNTLIEEAAPFKIFKENNPVNIHPVESAPVKNNRVNILLIALSLLLMALSGWLYWQWQNQNKVVDIPVKRNGIARNADELKLQTAIDQAKGDTLLLADTAFKQPILLTDTLHIRKDSLYIKGNITLKRDTMYHGPALVIEPKGKLTGFEGIIFQDFDSAVYAFNSALLFKNVKFINCGKAVLKAYVFPENKLISTYLSTATYHADSIAKASPKPNGTK